MTNPEKKVENIKRHIRNVLKNSGGYDVTLGYQIELVATDILLYRKIREAVQSLDTVTITEKSREGNDRIKPHPLIFELREQSKVVSRGLDMLMMNIKSKKGKAEAADAFASFMDRMGEE